MSVQDYDFDIQFKPGAIIKVADELSREFVGAVELCSYFTIRHLWSQMVLIADIQPSNPYPKGYTVVEVKRENL